MSTLINREVLNQREHQAFPLSHTAGETDESGSFRLPRNVLLEMALPIDFSEGIDPTRFFLHHLTVFSTGVSFEIGYDDGFEIIPVATASIDSGAHTSYTAYPIIGRGAFGGTIGSITVGEIADNDDLPPGRYTFDLENGALAVEAIRPQIRFVRSVVVVQGAETSPAISGALQFIGGQNAVISVQGEGDGREIRFDAISNAGLEEECICEDQQERPCISTINGVRPDANRNINILGKDCVSISPVEHGLMLTDTCAEPCCGPEELLALVEELQKLREDRDFVKASVDRAVGATDNVINTVLAATLSDVGCDTINRCEDGGEESSEDS